MLKNGKSEIIINDDIKISYNSISVIKNGMKKMHDFFDELFRVADLIKKEKRKYLIDNLIKKGVNYDQVNHQRKNEYFIFESNDFVSINRDKIISDNYYLEVTIKKVIKGFKKPRVMFEISYKKYDCKKTLIYDYKRTYTKTEEYKGFYIGKVLNDMVMDCTIYSFKNLLAPESSYYVDQVDVIIILLFGFAYFQRNMKEFVVNYVNESWSYRDDILRDDYFAFDNYIYNHINIIDAENFGWDKIEFNFNIIN